MQRNRTRLDLHNDILQSLGHPAIKVYLTQDQINNSINAAIKQFWKWSYEGSYECYYKYQVTDTDVARGWVKLPENIDTVVSIIPTTAILGNMQWHTPEWQLTNNAVMSASRFAPLSLVDYQLARQRLSDIRSVLGNNIKRFEFIRLQHRVVLHFPLQKDDILLFHTYVNIDPEGDADFEGIDAPLMFDNERIKKLAQAYCLQQQGMIMKRFQGMQVTGGVTLDGDALIQMGNEAEDEIMNMFKNEAVDNFYMA